MRITFVISFLFAALLAGCGGESHRVVGFADDIRRAIPTGWSVSTSNATIRIQSERDVTLIGRISRPPMPGGMKELAQRMGQTTKYDVTLSFVPRLSTIEVEQLHAARRPFELVLDTGARSKSEYDDALRGYEQHSVPTFYTDDYSIFVDRPIDSFVEVYPPDAAAQVESLMVSLKKVFHEY